MSDSKEIWKPIPKHPLYEVSSLGNVRSIDKFVSARNGSSALRKGKTLKQSTKRHGYKVVVLSDSYTRCDAYVHRLVAMAFLNYPEVFIVNHKDGNPANNALGNLEIASTRENVSHSYRKRLLPIGAFKLKGQNKYQSKISVNGQSKYLGTFDTPDEASKAYLDALNKLNEENKYVR